MCWRCEWWLGGGAALGCARGSSRGPNQRTVLGQVCRLRQLILRLSHLHCSMCPLFAFSLASRIWKLVTNYPKKYIYVGKEPMKPKIRRSKLLVCTGKIRET